MDAAHKWDNFYTSESRESFLHFTNDQITSIIRDFPLAKTALDIGCGEGQLMVQLEKLNISTTGIDVSGVALGEARKQVMGGLIKSDFENFEFPAEDKFDLVFVKFVIAFMKDIPSFFKKIDNLLSPGGGFILLAPISNQPIDRNIDGNEIFIEQSVLDISMPKYFTNIREEILHAENEKKLSLFVCSKD